MLTELLTNYNFSDREAKIYLTSLEFGEDVVSSIARRAGENRVTTYSILKDLAKKGIANEITKNKKKYYSVISPEKLVKQEEDKYKKLRDALPDFMAVQSEYAHRPKMHFYEGIENMKIMYDDFRTTKTDFKAFIGTDKIDPEFHQRVKDVWRKKRLKFPVETYVIGTKWKQEYAELMYNHHHTLLIDNPKFKLPNEIVMYAENKVGISMFTPNEMSGIILESKTLHDSMISLFDVIRDGYKNK